MELKKVDILGVKVNDLSLDQALELVENWLKGKSFDKLRTRHYIVTPNPEFVMAAQKDDTFRSVLNKSDLAIPDGFGFRLFGKVQNTIAGVDLMEKLCQLAAEKGYRVGFLGGRDKVAVKVSECLQKKYPGLKVSLADDGGEVDLKGNMLTDYRLPTTAEDGRPKTVDLLFVAFGQVKQEKWISKNLPNIPVKVAMGVGGSFDELSGKAPRIPSWVHKIGLKWLVRLILEPWRIKRQLVLFRFAWLLLFES
ncbi:MAG: WecB/TagA/CpsF family glycosyltransferase [Candidatus Daviesbacteria bacterium]